MGGTQYILAGGLIDGSGAGVLRDVFMAVQDSIITAIGPATDQPRPKQAEFVDLSHCVILPPLVDCSVSLMHSPSVDWQVRLAAEHADPMARAAMLERHLSYCHVYGVLGVVANDDLDDLLAKERMAGAPGSVIDLRFAGPLCRTRQDCVAGPLLGRDFLKIDYTGNIEDQEPPNLRFNLKDLGRMLRNQGGKMAVVVVANGQQQVAEALAAGCDAIEQGYGMGEANLRMMAAKKVLWIPSVLRAKNGLDGVSSGGEVCCRFSQRYVAPGKPNPGAEAYWKKTLAEQLSQLRLARKLGVTTAVGTGAGSVGILHGESMAEEMKLFMKAGYSLAETIRCASENGARFFGMKKLGILAAGRPATFLITRGSLQQLPRKLSYLEGIYIDGAPSSTYHKNPVKTG